MPFVAVGIPRCASCHRSLPWLVEASDDSFAAAVAAPGSVLVELWAPWCEPCRYLAPAVEKAADEFAGRLKVVKVNVDEGPDVAELLGARVVPTLVVVRDGQEVARRVGAIDAPALMRWLRQLVPVPPLMRRMRRHPAAA